jgi:quercetin dioxygenase-like cupin family protein
MMDKYSIDTQVGMLEQCYYGEDMRVKCLKLNAGKAVSEHESRLREVLIPIAGKVSIPTLEKTEEMVPGDVLHSEPEKPRWLTAIRR